MWKLKQMSMIHPVGTQQYYIHVTMDDKGNSRESQGNIPARPTNILYKYLEGTKFIKLNYEVHQRLQI